MKIRQRNMNDTVIEDAQAVTDRGEAILRCFRGEFKDIFRLFWRHLFAHYLARRHIAELEGNERARSDLPRIRYYGKRQLGDFTSAHRTLGY